MKPIIFSSEMVRAILDGRKTQTRRIIKPQPVTESPEYQEPPEIISDGTLYFSRLYLNIKCPYGQVGDTLWVRETHRYIRHPYRVPAVQYKDGKEFLSPKHAAYMNKRVSNKWKSPIFLPKWATRIFLEITDIRVERLWDISEKDAEAEGFEYTETSSCAFSAKYSFGKVWDSIHKKRDYKQDKNPWVWVVEFKRIDNG